LDAYLYAAYDDFVVLERAGELASLYRMLDLESIDEQTARLQHPFLNRFNLPVSSALRQATMALTQTLCKHAVLEFHEAPYETPEQAVAAVLKSWAGCNRAEDFHHQALLAPDPNGHLQAFLSRLISLGYPDRRGNRLAYHTPQFSIEQAENGDLHVHYVKSYRKTVNTKVSSLRAVEKGYREFFILDWYDFVRHFNGELSYVIDFINRRLLKLVCLDFDNTLVPFNYDKVHYNFRTAEFFLPPEDLNEVDWCHSHYPDCLHELASQPEVRLAVITNNHASVVRQVFNKLLPAEGTRMLSAIVGRPSGRDSGPQKFVKIRGVIDELDQACIARDNEQRLLLTADCIFNERPLAVCSYGLVDDTHSNCQQVTQRGGWAVPVSPENPYFFVTALKQKFGLRLKALEPLPQLKRCNSALWAQTWGNARKIEAKDSEHHQRDLLRKTR